MAKIVAERLVEHLERSGFIVMKKPPIGASAAPYRGEVPSWGPPDPHQKAAIRAETFK